MGPSQLGKLGSSLPIVGKFPTNAYPVLASCTGLRPAHQTTVIHGVHHPVIFITDRRSLELLSRGPPRMKDFSSPMHGAVRSMEAAHLQPAVAFPKVIDGFSRNVAHQPLQSF